MAEFTLSQWLLMVNTFKIPFSAQLGLITPVSLKVNLLLLPGIAVGALAGILFARRVPRHVFDWLVQALAAAGAIKLLF